MDSNEEKITLEDSKTVYYLAYGDYRRRECEYTRLKKVFGNSTEGGLIYIETIKVTGYRMYDNGLVPVCEYTGNKDDKIVCDVLKLSKIAFRVVNNSERALGMESNIVFNKQNSGNIKHLVIYLAPTSVDISNYERIKEGDWSTYSIKFGFN